MKSKKYSKIQINRNITVQIIRELVQELKGKNNRHILQMQKLIFFFIFQTF